MPAFRTTRNVVWRADQMFALVADVEAYPQFLPLCLGLRVRKRSVDAEGREVIVADMEVGYQAIRETFTSKVTLDRGAGKILVEYVDGPFSRLENRWTFRDTGTEAAPRCSVEFDIDYAFRSRTLGMIVGAVFDRAFRKFSEAFETRAREVYGREKRATLAAS